MSWKSLSDVYSEGVNNNNSRVEIQPPKEWRSLSEVYTSAMKKDILNEGKVDIEMDNKTYSFSNLSDVYVREILQRAQFHEVEMNEIVEMWVKSGGWKGADINIVSNFIIGEINRLNRDIKSEAIDNIVGFDLIKKDIEQLINTKELEANKIFTNALQPGKEGGINDFNYLQILNREDLKVLKGQFIERVYNFGFSKSKTVNVGPGEVVATLFTEATAAEKGDLKVGENLIELKKQGGIVGQHGPGEKILHSMNKEIDAAFINLEREKEIKKLKDLINGDQEMMKLINNTLKQIQEKQKKSNDDKSIESIFEFLLSDEIYTKALDNLTIPGKMPSGLEKIKEVIKNVKEIKEGKVSKTINLFFSKKDISAQQEIVKQYLTSTNIPNDITPEMIFQSGLTPLQQIGAMSIVDYQIKEKFNYILLVGTNHMTRAIGPFGDNITENIEMVFNSVKDITFKMSGGRDTGKIEMFSGSAPAKDDSIAQTTASAAIPALDPQAEGEKLNIPT